MLLNVLGNLALGLLVYVLVTFVVAFNIAAKRTPSPEPGMPQEEDIRRLAQAFVAQLRAIVSSALFWALAAIITAAIVAGTMNFTGR